MANDDFLIRDYAVGSTLPDLDFVWEGENVTGYTITFTICKEGGGTTVLTAVIDAVGDGGSTPAEFHFVIPSGTWDAAGLHTGKLTVVKPSGTMVIRGFVFEVEDC